MSNIHKTSLKCAKNFSVCWLCLLEWEHQPIHPWDGGQWRTSCSTCSTVHCWLWHIQITIEMFDCCTFIGGLFILTSSFENVRLASEPKQHCINAATLKNISRNKLVWFLFLAHIFLFYLSQVDCRCSNPNWHHFYSPLFHFSSNFSLCLPPRPL